MNLEYINNLPVPACVVGTDKIISAANHKMKEVFVYDDIVGSNFFALMGIRREDLLKSNEEEIIVERNERFFKIRVAEDADINKDIAVFFDEKTKRENYKSKLESERPAMILINIDNYDELLASLPEDQKREVPSQIDKAVRHWGDSFESPIMSTDDDTYIMFSNYAKVQEMIEDEFSVLEEVRNIEAEVDFPISISIGIGLSDYDLNETNELADAALDLALGRGGDQAVLKFDDRTTFYGGSSQTVEKNNRGKARVIAHALKHLVSEADRVLIMGHRWPDMDSFGAAIGACSICRYLDKDAYIVLEEHNNAIDTIYQQVADSEDYTIIKREKAIDIADKGTLLIVVDVNRKSMMECPELVEKCKQIVLVDHHRLTEDSLQNTTIAYNESYASSASELVTEILQYVANKRFITKFEGEALLAGIMVDTNNFSGRTGVRTFEAAAWLRRSGADTTEVKRFFQETRDDFVIKAKAISEAEFTEDGIAYAWQNGESDNATVINAQVADELLMVKGVKASFVFGKNEKGQTIISARSLGDINVQALMEKLGGGGHFISAATQLDVSKEEAKEQLDAAIEEYLNKSSEEE